MKKFLKYLFIFLSIPLLCSILSLIVIFYNPKNINFSFDNNIREIYIGDSHIQCAVNDNLLVNSRNVSIEAESYYFTYYKLKKIINQNHNIEKVYLGASYHSLSNYYDDYISGKFSASISPKYFYILPIKDKFKVIFWNLKYLPNFIQGILPISYGYLFKHVPFDYGSYRNNFINVMAVKSSMDKRLHFQYYRGKELNDFSEINITYLIKIIALCKDNNVELVLLNTPVHPYFKSNIPINYINKFNEIVSTQNLHVIDLSVQNLSDSCFIPDGDHLSAKGAYLFTNELLKLKQMETTTKNSLSLKGDR